MDIEKVIYKGKIYTVIHKYNSGYWEIKELSNQYPHIELVHKSEVQSFSD